MALEITRVFVTGHNGFIGRVLIDLLKRENRYKVLIYEGDILDKKKLNEFFISHKPQYIIHLAGSFGFDLSELLKSNVLTTQLLLDLSNMHSVKKIIFTSSGAVYDCTTDSIKHEYDALTPNTPYGMSKKFAEDLIRFNNKYENSKMQFTILRFPNVYGSGQMKGILYTFKNEIDKHKKIIIHGDGSQKRDFLHVNDACSAIFLALRHSGSESYNISSPTSYTVSEIVDMFKEKYSFVVEHVSRRDKLEYLLLNDDRAKTILGYTAKVTKLEI